jgi:hypothetical protein
VLFSAPAAQSAQVQRQHLPLQPGLLHECAAAQRAPESCWGKFFSLFNAGSVFWFFSIDLIVFMVLIFSLNELLFSHSQMIKNRINFVLYEGTRN